MLSQKECHGFNFMGYKFVRSNYILTNTYSLLRKNGLIFIQEMHSHSLIKTSIILNKFFLINYI